MPTALYVDGYASEQDAITKSQDALVSDMGRPVRPRDGTTRLYRVLKHPSRREWAVRMPDESRYDDQLDSGERSRKKTWRQMEDDGWNGNG